MPEQPGRRQTPGWVEVTDVPEGTVLPTMGLGSGLRRKPPSVDKALQRGLLRSWCWRPQRRGEPLVEMCVGARCFLLPEQEADAFAEGLMAGRP